MGLLDFFSRKPTPSRIDKNAKRMLNEHHQQQVRQESLEELVGFGTTDAISALIRRLGVNFRDTIVNEQEKKWVSNVLVEQFPDLSVEPLVAFISNDQTISAAIRTLARLIEPEQLTTILIEALETRAPEDHRTISARLQLVDALSDIEDLRITETLLPYLMDHDDDVRIKVIETLEQRLQKRGKMAVERELADRANLALVGVLKDPEASGRITRRAAEALRAVDADVGRHALELVDFLPEGYAIDDRGRLEKR